MVYARVVEETKERLLIRRDPSYRSWAVAVGIVSCGLGAAIYSNDHILLKMLYIFCSMVIANSCLENWEECCLDNVSGMVSVCSTSLLNRVQRLYSGQQLQYVTAALNRIKSVDVVPASSGLSGKRKSGHHVVLRFEDGFSVSITETATEGDKSEHERLAARIVAFVRLDEQWLDNLQSSDSSSTSGDEEFELCDKSEIINESLTPHCSGELGRNTENAP